MDELEQLRVDYDILKRKLEEQEIVNDKLLRKTMKKRVGSLRKLNIFEYVIAILVIAVSPWAFHYNPSVNASWWFIGATDMMMVFCLVMTIRYNRKVASTNAMDVNLREFCANLKELREKWINWLRIAIPMVLFWVSWLITEIWLHVENHKLAIGTIAGMLVGGTIGGIIGNNQRRRIIRYCDEIIGQIDN